MPSSKNRVFAFETPEQAWSFVNIASTAGYTLFEGISPSLAEARGAYYVSIPGEYVDYLHDLKRISRTVKASTSNTMNEHMFTFDKFVQDDAPSTVIRENDGIDEPMRRRAQRHQELPLNRIRIVNNG